MQKIYFFVTFELLDFEEVEFLNFLKYFIYH